jgi:hypothetical protein
MCGSNPKITTTAATPPVYYAQPQPEPEPEVPELKEPKDKGAATTAKAKARGTRQLRTDLGIGGGSSDVKRATLGLSG